MELVITHCIFSHSNIGFGLASAGGRIGNLIAPYSTYFVSIVLPVGVVVRPIQMAEFIQFWREGRLGLGISVACDVSIMFSSLYYDYP